MTLAVTTLKAGAAEFFEKPVDEDRLMKAIAKLCREVSPKAAANLPAGILKKHLTSLLSENAKYSTHDQDVSSQQIAERLGLSGPHHLCAPERHLPKARNKKSVEYFARRSR